jgi:class 3 adenylate cyclase/tetratricopeptide (TPR) repeat protein
MIRKTVTLVFCDVTGSTSLGESLDPETVRAVMSRYFAVAQGALERHGGTVEKFVGDAVMAAFGIPTVHEDDALRAVRAAAELREELVELNAELEREFGVRIGVRTGVNTGEVIAGDPSRGQDFATGDAVVVTQRLEAVAEPGEVLLGDSTYQLVRDLVEVDALPPLELKGRAEPVGAWRLVGVSLEGALPFRSLDSPLVGRTVELAHLRRAFCEAVDERRCRVITILGDAGVGKSRLAAELETEVGGTALALHGRCLPYGRGITYWPVAEIVRAAAGIPESASPDEAEARIASLLVDEPDATLVAVRIADLVGAGGGRSRSDELSWAVRRLLEALARHRPVLLVLDDVQWAEPTLLDLIEYLAGWTRGAPILLCCLARPDLLEVRPSWHEAIEIRLQPLVHEDARELMENVVGPLDAGVADAVVDLAEGNPLFLEELLRMLVEDESLVEHDGAWSLAREPGRLRVPGTIQAVLAARLDRLPSEELSVLQSASVIGQEFWWSAVTALCPPEDRAAVPGRLLALLRTKLIRPDRDAPAGEDGFRFGHILVRDSVYDSIPKGRRAELHERLAGWMEEQTSSSLPGQNAIHGYHLEQAFRYRVELSQVDEWARAASARGGASLAAAGRRALAQSDVAAAVNLLERAATLLREGGVAGAGVMVDLGTALRDRGDLQEADEVLASAIGEADAIGDLVAAARARVERAALRVNLDPELDLDEMGGVAEQAIAVFEEAEDELGLARAWRLVAAIHWAHCRLGEQEAVLERALVHAQRLDDQREISEISAGLGAVAVFGPTPVEEGIERCRTMLGRALDSPRLQAFVKNDLAVLLAAGGEFEQARELLAEAQSTFDALGVGPRPSAMYIALVELLAGEPAAAEQELRASFDELERRGERSWLSTTAALLARALCEQARLAEAEHYSVISEDTVAPDDVATQVIWRSSRARVLAGRGEGEAALRLAHEAVELASRTDWLELHAWALLDLAEVHLALGAVSSAGGCIERAISLCERKGNLALVARGKKQLGQLAELDGRPGTR